MSALGQSHQLMQQPQPLGQNLGGEKIDTGRVQNSCRRALWAVAEASTPEIVEWAYARRLLALGDQRRNGFNRVARRALKEIGADAGLCETGDTDDYQVDRHDVVQQPRH